MCGWPVRLAQLLEAPLATKPLSPSVHFSLACSPYCAPLPHKTCTPARNLPQIPQIPLAGPFLDLVSNTVVIKASALAWQDLRHLAGTLRFAKHAKRMHVF